MQEVCKVRVRKAKKEMQYGSSQGEDRSRHGLSGEFSLDTQNSSSKEVDNSPACWTGRLRTDSTCFTAGRSEKMSGKKTSFDLTKYTNRLWTAVDHYSHTVAFKNAS